MEVISVIQLPSFSTDNCQGVYICSRTSVVVDHTLLIAILFYSILYNAFMEDVTGVVHVLAVSSIHESVLIVSLSLLQW